MECPECLKNNQHSNLKLYQINYTEAIYMCPEKLCNYPNNKKWNIIQQNLFRNDFDLDSDSSDSDIETITKIFTNHARKKIRKKTRLKNLTLTSPESKMQNSSDDEGTVNRAFNILTSSTIKNGKKLNEKVNQLLGCDIKLGSDSSDSDFNFSEMVTESVIIPKSAKLNQVLPKIDGPTQIQISLDRDDKSINSYSQNDLNIPNLNHFDLIEKIQGSESKMETSLTGTILENSLNVSNVITKEENYVLKGDSKADIQNLRIPRSCGLFENSQLDKFDPKCERLVLEDEGLPLGIDPNIVISVEEPNICNVDKNAPKTSAGDKSSSELNNLGSQKENRVLRSMENSLNSSANLSNFLENPNMTAIDKNVLKNLSEGKSISKLDNLDSKIVNRVLRSMGNPQSSCANLETYNEEPNILEQGSQNIPKSDQNDLESLRERKSISELDNLGPKIETMILKPMGNPLIRYTNLENSTEEPNIHKSNQNALKSPPEVKSITKVDNFGLKTETCIPKPMENPLTRRTSLNNPKEEPNVPILEHIVPNSDNPNPNDLQTTINLIKPSEEPNIPKIEMNSLNLLQNETKTFEEPTNLNPNLEGKILPFPIKINISASEKGQNFHLTLENLPNSGFKNMTVVPTEIKPKPKKPQIGINLAQQKMAMTNKQKTILKVFSKEKIVEKPSRFYGRTKLKEPEMKLDISAVLKASGVQNGVEVETSKSVEAKAENPKPVVIKGLGLRSRSKKCAAKFEGFKFTSQIIKKADNPEKKSNPEEKVSGGNVSVEISDKKVFCNEKVTKSEDILVQSPPDVSFDLNLTNIQINESFTLDKCNISNLDELLNDIDLENNDLNQNQQNDFKSLDDVDDWLKSLVN